MILTCSFITKLLRKNKSYPPYLDPFFQNENCFSIQETMLLEQCTVYTTTVYECSGEEDWHNAVLCCREPLSE